jgi:O-antigen/teichoic acid export membrane protein
LRWGLNHANAQELHALLRPALAYLAFPLGNGLSIQAITLIVGALSGAVAVAIFNTYRTLSRIVLQLTASFSHSVWVEFSQLYGANDAESLQHIYRRGLRIGAAISILLSIAVIPIAPYLLQWWTHGKIEFDRPLFLLFVLATLIGGLAHVPRVLLMSTNCHGRLGLLYLGLSTLGVVTAFLLTTALGSSGALLASTAVEASMLYFSMTLASRLLVEMQRESANANR